VHHDAVSRTLAHSRVERVSEAWAQQLARLGLGARAIVYVIVSAIAADVAVTGGAPAPASSDGAFTEVVRQPAGPVLLGIVAGGLLAYALWRLLTALLPSLSNGLSGWERMGAIAIAVVYVGLLVQAVGVISKSSSLEGPSSHPSPYVATVLRWPTGPFWVGAAGIAVVLAGAALSV
jgi:hypothetical protein